MTCKICKDRFENALVLQHHVSSDHRKCQFACDQCGKLFSSKVNLRDHMAKIHGIGEVARDYMCEICSKTFNSKGQWITHKKVCYRLCYPLDCV